jgi:hypothetical protein
MSISLLKTGVRVGSSTSRSGSIAKEAKALAVAWASVRECPLKKAARLVDVEHARRPGIA